MGDGDGVNVAIEVGVLGGPRVGDSVTVDIGGTDIAVVLLSTVG